MLHPLYKNLKSEIFDDQVCSVSFAQKMHPNPLFYKYLWWIFWRESPCEGEDFFQEKNALCTAKAMILINKLKERKERHFIYNTRKPRYEKGVTPFDPNHPRWEGVEFYSSWSEDTDPEYMGYR
ncbi:MAG: hypothetical protein Q4A28_08070 [Brachymonas sp.]|nr:hypothetical protein [Brachymonas sp.]